MQVPRRTVLAALGAGAASLASRPSLGQEGADPPRPRVLATADDFDRIARLVEADGEYVSGWDDAVRSRADEVLDADPVEYELPDGVRLLPISRRVLSRVRTLGLVYRVSGEKRYAERAWQELEAAAGFPDWNPAHFLDVAEMSAAFGTAYDWLYDYWDPDRRETIRSALVGKGLDLGIAAHEGTAEFGSWWTDDEYNWNAVCNGGLTVGALALVGEDRADREKLETLLGYTTERIVRPFETFGEDGGWPEGYNYWNYNTRYLAYYLTTTLNTLGEGSGLDVNAGVPDVDGFPSSGDFPIGMTGPEGAFNYGDSPANRRSMPVLFWLARQFDEPAWAAFQRETIGSEGGDVTDLLWYDPESVGSVDAKPRDVHFRGVHTASFRTGWDDAAGYVGFKGGNNQFNHGDLDLGSFVYDAAGRRWATDLGAENYNVPDYWDMNDGRWDYYRKRAEGHNTLVVNPGEGPDQLSSATAAITAFETGEGGAYGIVDLSDAYRVSYFSNPEDSTVRRGFAFDRETGALLVQDELSLAEAVPVWWFMHTRASPEVGEDGRTATLGGLTSLRARILAPEGATFQVMDARPLPSSPDPDVQAENADVEKLAIELEDVTETRIAVQLVPPSDGEAPDPPEVGALDGWTVAYAAGDADAPESTPTTTEATTTGTTTTSTGGPGFGAVGALGGAGLAAWRLARRRDDASDAGSE